jgi:hypothetical protein
VRLLRGNVGAVCHAVYALASASASAAGMCVQTGVPARTRAKTYSTRLLNHGSNAASRDGM